MNTRRHPPYHALGAAALAALLPALAAHPAQAQGFTGAYAPAQWTTSETTDWNGTAANDGSTLTLTSPEGDGLPQTPQGGYSFLPEIDYSLAAPAAGAVTFDWASASDFYNGVPFGYFVGDPSQAGDRFPLSGPADHTNSGNTQSGRGQTFTVAAGRPFGFYIDSQVGEGTLTGTLTVSNFSGPAATPAPEPPAFAGFALGALGLAALALRARRRAA